MPSPDSKTAIASPYPLLSRSAAIGPGGVVGEAGRRRRRGSSASGPPERCRAARTGRRRVERRRRRGRCCRPPTAVRRRGWRSPRPRGRRPRPARSTARSGSASRGWGTATRAGPAAAAEAPAREAVPKPMLGAGAGGGVGDGARFGWAGHSPGSTVGSWSGVETCPGGATGRGGGRGGSSSRVGSPGGWSLLTGGILPPRPTRTHPLVATVCRREDRPSRPPAAWREAALAGAYPQADDGRSILGGVAEDTLGPKTTRCSCGRTAQAPPDRSPVSSVPARGEQEPADARRRAAALRTAGRRRAGLRARAVHGCDGERRRGHAALPQAPLPLRQDGRSAVLARGRAVRHRAPRPPQRAADARPGPRAPRAVLTPAQHPPRLGAPAVGGPPDRRARRRPGRDVHQDPPRPGRRHLRDAADAEHPVDRSRRARHGRAVGEAGDP